MGLVGKIVAWDPGQYLKFGEYRDRPFFDLTARIGAREPQGVVDLGCGPGRLTARLASRWPGAHVQGVDSSPEMLAHAAPYAAESARLTFRLAEIAAWSPPAGTDVVVSNAALHWVPGHRTLLRSWLAELRPGAWFALQVPGNFRAPSHTALRELAESPRWSGLLGGLLPPEDAVGDPDDYLEIMLDAGFDAEAWETTYQQLLPGPAPVLEWVKGAALRPVLAALDPAAAAGFVADYSARLNAAYPPGRHGTVFAFRRIFAVGCKRSLPETGDGR